MVATYRCYHHYRSLRALGFGAVIVGEVSESVLRDHDAFVLASPATPGLVLVSEWLRSHGKRVWFDVPEDLFSAYYDEQPTAAQRQGLEYARTLSRYADVLTVSNDFLGAQAGCLNDAVFTVPSFIDQRVWDVPVPSSRSGLGIPEDAVTLGWAGAADGFAPLELMQGTLARVIAEYSDAFFVSIGDDPQLALLPHDRCLHLPIRGMDEYADFMRHIDVGIVPGLLSLTTLCTSDLKVVEHGMAGSAVVAFDAPAYSHLAEDAGVPLVSNGSEWADALGALLSDKAARLQAAEALRAYVVGHRLLDDNAESCRAPFEALSSMVGTEAGGR
jgi:glycosyltransferase involved in cell wall biosynthesis